MTRFFHNLPGDSWLKIAHFMNCEQKVISAILKECSAVGNQVQMFLRWWRMPDCGKQCNLDVLKRLKKSCGIKDGNADLVQITFTASSQYQVKCK